MAIIYVWHNMVYIYPVLYTWYSREVHDSWTALYNLPKKICSRYLTTPLSKMRIKIYLWGGVNHITPPHMPPLVDYIRLIPWPLDPPHSTWWCAFALWVRFLVHKFIASYPLPISSLSTMTMYFPNLYTTLPLPYELKTKNVWSPTKIVINHTNRLFLLSMYWCVCFKSFQYKIPPV